MRLKSTWEKNAPNLQNGIQPMFDKFKKFLSTEKRDEELQKHLEELRQKTPVPVFWLFGKTQSGKTSVVKFLTGADEAEIGQGFKPCTQYSQLYDFPNPEAPMLSFLDTRGVDEPGYDPQDDLDRFDATAHVVVVTVKVLDHSLDTVVKNLRLIRKSNPERPVVLCLTCLNEAMPQQQHPQPYEEVRWFEKEGEESPGHIPLPEGLAENLAVQLKRFEGLYDHVVPLDLTKPEEGYQDPEYGGQHLKEVLLASLPSVYQQTLVNLTEGTDQLSDIYAQHAVPHIMGFSTMAASAGAIPIPGIDLFLIPGIQSRMIYHLAQYYGQPMTGERFLELAGSLGLGVVVRQATRQVVKFIPIVGSVVGAALAFGATFALGKAFCYYYSSVHRGHVPKPDDLKKYYKEQLKLAEEAWKKKKSETQ